MTKTSTLVGALWSRFILQDAVYVEQWKSADKSGYRKVVDEQGNNVPLNREAVEEHLKGNVTLGIYQLRDDRVKTICWDVDTENVDDAKKMTLRLAKVLAEKFGKGSFLVENSGSKGYHLWMFFPATISAFLGLRTGRWIASLVEPIDGVTIEVFPKQEEAFGGYGNLIKLPWGLNLKTKKRCVFVDGKFEQIEDQFEALKNVKVMNVEDEDQFIAAYNIPNPPRVVYEQGDKYLCVTDVLQNGMVQGHRDIALHKLSIYFRRAGLPAEYTESILEQMNDKSANPVSSGEIQSKIDGAYRNNYLPGLCKDPGFDVYCSEHCALFAYKAEQRGVTVEQLRRRVGIHK